MKTSLSLISLAILSSSAIANNIDVNALPKNHQLTQGDASISQSNNAMTIDQKAIVFLLIGKVLILANKPVLHSISPHHLVSPITV